MGIDANSAGERLSIQHVFDNALKLYVGHAQTARPKSSRQLMNTLTKCLQKLSQEEPQLKQKTLDRLVVLLCESHEPHAAKSSMQLFGQLITKDIANLDDVLAALRRNEISAIEGTCNSQSRSAVGGTASEWNIGVQALLSIAFAWLGKGDYGSTVAQFSKIVLDKWSLNDSTGSSADDPPSAIWIAPLEQACQQHGVNMNDLRAHLFPVLFKRDLNDFVSFLYAQGLESLLLNRDARSANRLPYTLLYTALQAGKELGLLGETQENAPIRSLDSLLLPIAAAGQLLQQGSHAARLTGLSILITSHSATRPFFPQALKLILKGLAICFADVDADFRGDVFSAFQKLLDRLRAITAVLAKQISSEKGVNASKDVYDPQTTDEHFTLYLKFLKRLLRFLTQELRPTASYQRHISAVKCLLALARSGLDKAVPSRYHTRSATGDTKWPFRLSLLTAEVRRLLLDSTLDPYDDVRQTASLILGLYCSTLSQEEEFVPERCLSLACERAEARMLHTGRADHADGVAHLYSLCYNRYPAEALHANDFCLSGQGLIEHLNEKLGSTLAVARQNVGQAADRYPIHGLCTSIRYILMQETSHKHNDLRRRLFKRIQDIWEIVKPMLCNDAPEGHVPDELEDDPESARGALSFCWRALKEASLLLSALASQADVTDDPTQEDFLKAMGNLCFSQLAELRHRGAFSTVAQTWTTCCLQSTNLQAFDGTHMLMVWYNRAIQILRSNVTINTRRSGGLPALICGALIADQSGLLFNKACVDLEQIARQEIDTTSAEEGNLAQVHAMNCLKDILKNTRLGEQSEGKVPDALRLAADALQSDVWAIRNCGLMLFRAVIDRLLGTDQSHLEEEIAPQKRISYEQNPQLLGLVLSLLPQDNAMLAVNAASYEGVFPALQVLQYMRLPTDRLDEVESAIQKLLGSQSWHVRDRAARTLSGVIVARSPQVRVRDQTTTVELALAKLDSILLSWQDISENQLHGFLLTARYTIEYLARDSRPVEVQDPMIQLLVNVVRRSHHMSGSHVTYAACLDLVRTCWDLTLALEPVGHTMQSRMHLLEACVDGLKNPAKPVTILEALLSDSLELPNAAVKRQAVARLMAQQLNIEHAASEQEMQLYAAMIMRLAEADHNAAQYFMRSLELSRLHENEGSHRFASRLSVDILRSSLGVEVKQEAQRVLIQLLAEETPEEEKAPMPLVLPADVLELSGCNQKFSDQSLALRAIQLEKLSVAGAMTEYVQRTVDWISDCVQAVTGNGVYTREAAANALDRVDSLWRVMNTDERLDTGHQRICVATYDLLNDDDENIRLLAAQITQRILVANGDDGQSVYEPCVSRQRLMSFLVKRWASSAHLTHVMIERTFGLSDEIATPFADQLLALSGQEIALFGEEKQNLYIDEATEARIWSRAAQKLDPSAIAPNLLVKLASWVADGLGCLKSHAEAHEDGPLGWTTKADIYTLGMRVIYGAETLLVLSIRGCRLPVPPSQIRLHLYQCQVAFRASAVNGLWCWEIDRVLSESVSSELALINNVTNAIGGGKWGLK